MNNLQRFSEAHQQHFNIAFTEIKKGKKISHWMWYIFPQLKELGRSAASKFYGIENLHEAQAFLEDPQLGKNLIAITSELLKLKTNNVTVVFGKPDDMKLHSCMTLFALVPDTNVVFSEVLHKFFDGKKDGNTIELLQEIDKD